MYQYWELLRENCNHNVTSDIEIVSEASHVVMNIHRLWPETEKQFSRIVKECNNHKKRRSVHKSLVKKWKERGNWEEPDIGGIITTYFKRSCKDEWK